MKRGFSLIFLLAAALPSLAQTVKFSGPVSVSGTVKMAVLPSTDTLFSFDSEGATIVPPFTTENDSISGVHVALSTVRAHSGSQSIRFHYDQCNLTGASAAPTLSCVSLPGESAATYYAKYAYDHDLLASWGQRALSTEASIACSADQTLKVTSPAGSTIDSPSSPPAGLHWWDVFVTLTSGVYTTARQNGTTPLVLGTDWTKPAGALVSGSAPNSSDCTTSTDINHWVLKTLSPTQDHLYVRSYVYLEPPVGSSNNGRKLFYIFSPIDAGCGGGSCWSVIVAIASTLRMTVTSQHYGQASEVWWDLYPTDPATIDWSNVHGWYTFEFEILANTPGSSDGRWTLWVDGVQKAQQTGISPRLSWTAGLQKVEIGDQEQQNGSNTICHTRYWDDVVISTTYIGP